jgi:hypothetical protein
MPEQHTILAGKIYVYKRPNSSLWQCSTYLAGKKRRISTKEEGLAKAKEIAQDWYLKLRENSAPEKIKTDKDLSRSLRTLPARVRHHDAGATQPRICGLPRPPSRLHLANRSRTTSTGAPGCL